MLERSDIEHPLWRKKVDKGLLRDGVTPIPSWLWIPWEIERLYGSTLSKKDASSAVSIEFNGSTHQGFVARSKTKSSSRFRLFFEKDLMYSLSETFPMTYMRVIEGEITQGKNHRNIEKDISFWEFLDIEFDSSKKTFKFNAHYTVQPTFPELSRRLIKSAPLKAISETVFEKNKAKIHKQDWKPRQEYKFELGAENVIYMLIDTKDKLLYLGEAGNLVKRFDNEHPIIKNWDYYKYDVLPPELATHRLEIERMMIRDFASVLENNQSIDSFSISEYKLANKKIDK